MAQVINSESAWDLEMLLEETARGLIDDYKKYPHPEEIIIDKLLRFLKRLPNVNLSEEIKKELSRFKGGIIRDYFKEIDKKENNEKEEESIGTSVLNTKDTIKLKNLLLKQRKKKEENNGNIKK